MVKPKNDDVTIYKVRLSRRKKRVYEDLVRVFAILFIMAACIGLAYACDVYIGANSLRDRING